MKERKWYYIMPVLGVLFGIWYLRQAFYEVVYTDYIRLVDTYLPDVWNPDKFFVPDVLTRIPMNYLGRIINTTFFHYQLRFDQTLGVISLGLSALVTARYCRERRVGAGWFLAVMAVIFSLNKWEMMINGSGWVHFLAFAGFYYHYLIMDRVWAGMDCKRDRRTLLWLPWVLTLAVAGPYCAIYTVTVTAGYLFCMAVKRIKSHVWEKAYLGYGISVLIPFLLYLWSNSYAVEDHAGAVDGSLSALIRQFLETPGFFVRFFVKSFSSMVVGGERAEQIFSSNFPYYVLGLFVIACYLAALWLNLKHRLYEKTVFPLLLVVAGGLNHVLILVSRWIFLLENYGISSRYALQFQIGIVGILLTYAMAWQTMREGAGRVCADSGSTGRIGTKPGKKGHVCGAIWPAAVLITGMIFVGGNVYTSYHEILKAPYRKAIFMERAEIALDFENRSDEELQAAFEYRTGNPETGPKVRRVLTILRDNRWSVFYCIENSSEISDTTKSPSGRMHTPH